MTIKRGGLGCTWLLAPRMLHLNQMEKSKLHVLTDLYRRRERPGYIPQPVWTLPLPGNKP
jgi:hypothetical protein